jgi:quercetin dioxygenase-like cupin family protein
MKKFFAGLFVGLLASTLVLVAQNMAGEKGVKPQMITDNAKVEMVRWVLKPGERTIVHQHDITHIGVVIHGSTIRYYETDGTSKDGDETTGGAEYVPATGKAHSFENVGKETFEAVSIHLK